MEDVDVDVLPSEDEDADEEPNSWDVNQLTDSEEEADEMQEDGAQHAVASGAGKAAATSKCDLGARHGASRQEVARTESAAATDTFRDGRELLGATSSPTADDWSGAAAVEVGLLGDPPVLARSSSLELDEAQQLLEEALEELTGETREQVHEVLHNAAREHEQAQREQAQQRTRAEQLEGLKALYARFFGGYAQGGDTQAVTSSSYS